MIDWLYSLPDWLLLAACAAFMASVITVLPRATHRIPWSADLQVRLILFRTARILRAHEA